jgi:hypothetical protein
MKNEIGIKKTIFGSEGAPKWYVFKNSSYGTR